MIIDVELLEVDRTRLQEYGLQIASPGSPGINGSASIARRRRDAQTLTLQTLRNLTQADVLLAEPAGALLPAAQDRHQHAHAGQPAAAHVRGHRGAGALRRARAGAGHDVRADRDRRHAAAADHLVQLREHRREHRHHAAHAPRRRRDAGAEDGGAEHFGTGLRRTADVRQPRDQHGDPPARRRDQHAGRADSRRRTAACSTAFPG